MLGIKKYWAMNHKEDSQLKQDSSPEESCKDSVSPSGIAQQKPSKWKTYALLHIILLLYSLSTVCSKMAAQEEFGSFFFLAWYAGVLVILFVYAIVWQQVLKRMNLTTAYANKGITLFWGILWGALIFSEHISIWMLVGIAIVFVGILLVVTSDE